MSGISNGLKNPWVAIGVVVAVLIGSSVWYSMQVDQTNNEGVTLTDHVQGGADAKVTLIEYSDFQCPACGQFEPVVQEVLAEYGDQIRFEYKNFPLIQLHPFAEQAAVAAEAAGQQGKYFEYHNMLFAKQAEWTKGVTPSGFFTQYAEELGLDLETFARHQRSSLIREKVKADYKAAVAMGLTSTPTFFLNGTKMELSSIDDFKARIGAAVNPGANFNVTAGDEILKIVPVEGDASGAVPVAVPDVQFGL